MTDRAQLSNPKALRRRIRRRLRERWQRQSDVSRQQDHARGDSAVLLLLGRAWNGTGFGSQVGIFLNKRSAQVRQPGDICCPGGGLDPYKDRLLSQILALPGMPFGIHSWSSGNPGITSQGMALALATALRESWEEMRLNPLRFSFLGPLPAECLSLFKRRIHPLVGWSRKQRAFRPNWEVAAVPFIPLDHLLEPRNYVRLRLSSQAAGVPELRDRLPRTFTGFRFVYDGREEILWGATFRIVSRFLDLTFGFKPPDPKRLPLRIRNMAANYMGAQG